MKKITLMLILITILTVTTMSKTYAMIVFDPTNLVQNTASAIGDTISAAANPITAFQTTLNTAKITIADPIANAFKDQMVAQLARSTANWVAGGFQGNPSFVINPDLYFRNVQTIAIQQGLSQLKGSANLFSGSVANSIIGSVRNNRATVDQQTVYTLGGTIQNSVCTSQNDQNLINMAKNNLPSTASPSDIQTERTRLYQQLCTGGNALTDKTTQTKLSTCFADNFTCGGWKAWLDLTSNPNNTAYGNAANAQAVVTQKAGEKVLLAKDEVKQGSGYIGVKTCPPGKEIYDDSGNMGCTEWETQTPGDLVAKSSVNAAFSSLDTLKNAHGLGDILTSFVSQTINDLVTIGIGKVGSSLTGLNSSASYNVSNTINAGANTTVTGGGNTAVVTVSTGGTPLTASDKARIVDPIIVQLDKELNTINAIDNINAKYTSNSSSINTYETQVNSLDTCYKDVVNLDPALITNVNVISGKMYINDSKTKINNFRTKLKTNTDTVSSSKKLTINIKNLLASSTNASSISEIYQGYQNKVMTGAVPMIDSEKILDLEYQQTKNEMDTELQNDPTVYPDNLAAKLISCNRKLTAMRCVGGWWCAVAPW